MDMKILTDSELCEMGQNPKTQEIDDAIVKEIERRTDELIRKAGEANIKRRGDKKPG